MDTVERLVERSLQGEKLSTSRLISLVERGDESVPYILEKIYPHTGKAYCLGITGPPGAGKSSLVDKLAGAFSLRNLPVGIIAVDPCSPFTGGALLGDRIRMESRREGEDIFFRSMSAGRVMGGLAETTREVARILDASGRRIILIETVGVGQSELDIATAADTVIVVLTPEAGDGIQLMKAGLIEIADIFAVNKSDRPGADTISMALESMLDGREKIGKKAGWRPPVIPTSATLRRGIDALYEAVQSHHAHLQKSGLLEQRRKARLENELRRKIEEELAREIWKDALDEARTGRFVEMMWTGKTDPQTLARRIVRSRFRFRRFRIPGSGFRISGSRARNSKR